MGGYIILTVNQVKIQGIIESYRYKYASDPIKQDALNRIIWHSYPIVYGDCSVMKEAHKSLEARRRKKCRVKQRIIDMQSCYNQIYFITLTIDPDTMERLSERTLHRYVVSWFDHNCRDFVANSDHGDNTGRLHYHGVGALLRAKEDFIPSPFGFSTVELIGTTDVDHTRLSYYMGKLWNHSGKLTSGRIFSKRKQKSYIDHINGTSGTSLIDIDQIPF